MKAEEIERRLTSARNEVRAVLDSLEENIEPVHCVAQGKLEVAEAALEAVLDFGLAGDGVEVARAPEALAAARAARRGKRGGG